MDRIGGLLLGSSLLAACASTPPPKSTPPTAAVAAAPANAIEVGHPLDGIWRVRGTYVFIKKEGDAWRVLKMLPSVPSAQQSVAPKNRLAREGEVLFVSEDLKYVSPEFLVRDTEKSEKRAKQGLFTCFLIGFDDDSKDVYPNACNSDLTSSVEQLKNTAKQVAGAALTLGITAIAANKTKAVDPEKVRAAVESANVIPQVTHFRYTQAFEAAGSSRQLLAFIETYRGNDPDGLIPQAQLKLAAQRDKERLDAERSALEAKAAEQKRAKEEALAEQERERRFKEAEARAEQARLRAVKFRQALRPGDESHCGLVIEVKPPLVKLQTMIGEHWLRINQVYGAGEHRCEFVNGTYID